MKNTMMLIGTSLVILTMIGCAGKSDMQVISAGKIGCTPDKINIKNESIGVSTASWTAQCKNKSYYCSGDDMLRNISCNQINE